MSGFPVRDSLILDILYEYSMWLMEQGYMDTDWRDEEPYAITEYMMEKKQEK